MKLGVTEFVAYVEDSINSWITIPFIRIKCHFFISIVSFGFMTILSHIRISTDNLFLVPFHQSVSVHLFILRCCISLTLSCVSCKQVISGFCFLIYSVTLCHWIREWRPLVFQVSIEWCMLILVIVILIFWVIVSVSSHTLRFNNFGFIFSSCLSSMLTCIFCMKYNLHFCQVFSV